MEYKYYVDDTRLTYMDQGVLLKLQQESDFLSADDLFKPLETKSEVLKSLNTLEKYRYIIRKPEYTETEIHEEIFYCWLYKYNDKRVKDKC